MYRTHHCGALNKSFIGKTVTLSGWVQNNRDFGKLTFIDLRDRFGITQIVFNEEEQEILSKEARQLGREFVIQIEGTVIERSNKNLNICY
jgi:aspartyl-tRNA synthetase